MTSEQKQAFLEWLYTLIHLVVATDAASIDIEFLKSRWDELISALETQ